jgi:hypothetical protein
MSAQVRPSVSQLHSKAPVDGLHKCDRLSFSPVDRLKEGTLSAIFEVLQGTLDLLVLEILDSDARLRDGPARPASLRRPVAMEPGNAHRILLRLEQRG